MQTVATRPLFDISDDIRALEDLLLELGGDVSDEEVEQAIDNWFATLSTERDQKLDNYAALITEMEARAEIRKQEAERIRDRARVDENAAQRLKDRLVFFFRQHDFKTIETDRYRLTRCRAGGKQGVEVKASVAELPADYVRTNITHSPDLDKIREALEAGENLEFADLKERSEYLRIS